MLMRMVCLWDFITKYVKFKQEKKKKHNFKRKLLGKFVFLETKKVDNFTNVNVSFLGFYH